MAPPKMTRADLLLVDGVLAQLEALNANGVEIQSVVLSVRGAKMRVTPTDKAGHFAAEIWES